MHHLKILVVSDSETFNQIVIRYIELLPEVKVMGATTADQIVASGLFRRNDLDIVLIDLTSNGLAAINLIRKQLAEIGIFALTLTEVDELRDQALGAGVDHFISKTKIDYDLLQAIREFKKVRDISKNFTHN